MNRPSCCLVKYAGFPDWEGTQVLFDITPGDGTVNLRFSHSGFATLLGSFGVTSYSYSWYLRSVKLLLETGEGEPFGNAKIRALLGREAKGVDRQDIEEALKPPLLRGVEGA